MSEHITAKMLPIMRFFIRIGKAVLYFKNRAIELIKFIGGIVILFGELIHWIIMAIVKPGVKFRQSALIGQMVRVGVKSIGIITLVQVFIGIILVLQMSPTLADYGQLDKVANVIGVAVFRELGPLITAVVLSGFAGASIAAELGAMVEAEEVKALKAHALNPINFLVVPRVLATVFMMICLTVISDVVGVIGGFMTSVFILGIDAQLYLQNTQASLMMKDFITGLVKAGVFGLLISLIACFLGLRVTGGAEGVGRATTQTVVFSIVALIATDCLFTAFFYTMGW